MPVVIRLRSTGTKKKIKHRIVVADSKSPRDGRFIETVGTWDPSREPAAIVVKNERVEHWLKQGAKPSDTVRDILKKAGVTAVLKVVKK